ncbi:threonine-phosphate decarboxylase CobD [Clostridium sp. B9]|uniref:threonine-phosphate decarboxylase CobD n=1 Tax=Clostridium sp. B9 TaxID=3423224 RepID=UPI003D2ECB2D
MNLGHGGNVEEIKRIYNMDKILDFSANINPMGMSDKVHKAMTYALNEIERYPDITYFELKKAISIYENCNSEELVLGNGAAEVIFNIARALKPKSSLLIAPTFSEYEDALNSVGCKISHYLLKDKYSLDSDFLNEINSDIDILFLCNPNNPTGALIEKDLSLKILEKARDNGCTVVFDESFLDFVKDGEKYTLTKELNEFNNLIIVKSLTKLFAFPGIRLGYGLSGNSEYIEEINKVSTPWSVNTVADYAGRQALEEKEYIKESIEYIEKENKFLYEEINKIKNIKIFKGAVNFLFFEIKKEIDLRGELLKKGILIRSCCNYIGLNKRFYRIAVRTREENLELLKELKAIIN